MLEKYCSHNLADLDAKIFEIFDLSGNGLISDKELSQMLLTLPDQAIITDILDSKTKAKFEEPLSPLLNLKRKETLPKDDQHK